MASTQVSYQGTWKAFVESLINGRCTRILSRGRENTQSLHRRVAVTIPVRAPVDAELTTRVISRAPLQQVHS